MTVPATNKAHIKNELLQIEQDHSIDILFAVESGSRMWGFESPDSDYDVRFVYRSKDAAFYTGFKYVGVPYKDTIHFMSEGRMYDYCGWDLPKFMRHLENMNTSVVEWCHSPIVYINARATVDLMVQKSFQEYVKQYLNDFTRATDLLKPYMGMLMSKKCCSLENVKRAMYSARILLVLDLVGRNIVPAAFTWNYLIAETSWTAEQKRILKDLRQSKMDCAEKYAEMSVKARILLENKKDAAQQVKMKNVNESSLKESGEVKNARLAHIWETFVK